MVKLFQSSFYEHLNDASVTNGKPEHGGRVA